MKELLISFLKDYQQWLFYGAQEDETKCFTRGAGLCGQFRQWLHDSGLHDEARESYEWLGALYQKQGMSRCYPFHFDELKVRSMKNGEAEYFEEAYADKTHLNPRRLAWVTAMIKGELQ